MTFTFQITETVEIFKDPIGHYHHWTVLGGRLVEGTMHPGDWIGIPAVDGTRMGARIGGFEAPGIRSRSDISAGEYADPFGVMVWSPAPGEEEIALGVATSSSSTEFHELTRWALRHRPARLLHDRGPNGRGLPCRDCMRVLYSEGPVLHADFEPILRDLHDNPNPAIADLARDITGKSMSGEEHRQWRELELQKLAERKAFGWKFWQRK